MTKLVASHSIGQPQFGNALLCILWAPSWAPWIRAVVILVVVIIFKHEGITL
jgi:hypothetical protein